MATFAGLAGGADEGRRVILCRVRDGAAPVASAIRSGSIAVEVRVSACSSLACEKGTTSICRSSASNLAFTTAAEQRVSLWLACWGEGRVGVGAPAEPSPVAPSQRGANAVTAALPLASCGVHRGVRLSDESWPRSQPACSAGGCITSEVTQTASPLSQCIPKDPNLLSTVCISQRIRKNQVSCSTHCSTCPNSSLSFSPMPSTLDIGSTPKFTRSQASPRPRPFALMCDMHPSLCEARALPPYRPPLTCRC